MGNVYDTKLIFPTDFDVEMLTALSVGDEVNVLGCSFIVADHIKLPNGIKNAISFVEKFPTINDVTGIPGEAARQQQLGQYMMYCIRFGVFFNALDQDTMEVVSRPGTNAVETVHLLTKQQLEGEWEYFKNPINRKLTTSNGTPVPYWTATLSDNPKFCYCVTEDGEIVIKDISTIMAHRYGVTILYSPKSVCNNLPR